MGNPMSARAVSAHATRVIFRGLQHRPDSSAAPVEMCAPQSALASCTGLELVLSELYGCPARHGDGALLGRILHSKRPPIATGEEATDDGVDQVPGGGSWPGSPPSVAGRSTG